MLAASCIFLNKSAEAISNLCEGVDDDKKRSFVESLQQLDAEYPGGLKTFLATAKDLLEASSSGRNTLEGHVPSVPKGERLNFGSEEYEKFEEAGESISYSNCHRRYLLAFHKLLHLMTLSGLQKKARDCIT